MFSLLGNVQRSPTKETSVPGNLKVVDLAPKLKFSCIQAPF